MEREKDIYPLFKGLQKPLVFQMFKGRFIYMGIGGLIGSLFVGGVVCAFNNILGIIVMIGLAIPTFMYTLSEQKKGIYKRAKDYGIYIVKPNIVKRNGK